MAGLPRDIWDIADAVVSAIDNDMWIHPEEGRQISWGSARMAVGRAILADREMARTTTCAVPSPFHDRR